MKLKFIAILFFLSIAVLAQTNLGIGLISIHYNDKTILHFYSSIKDKKAEKIVTFFNDKIIDSWNIKNFDEQKKWLKPEMLWLDYDFFVFRCVKQENGWFQIIVNNENGKIYWLKKSEITRFKSWENYLKEMFGVERLTSKSQNIKKLPNKNSETIIYSGNDCFQVKSMKGDWIEIFTADYCDESYTNSKTKIKSG